MDHCFLVFINHFTSRPKCMSGSRDPGVTIVNPMEISVMYGYVTWRMTCMVVKGLRRYMGKARDFKTFPQATYKKIYFSLDLFLQLYFKILK